MMMRAKSLAFSIFLLCFSTKILGAELESEQLDIEYSILPESQHLFGRPRSGPV